MCFFLSTAKASSGVTKLIIESAAQRSRIISSIHDTTHMGVNRSIDMVAQKYYWPGLTKDVRTYVSTIIMLCYNSTNFSNGVIIKTSACTHI